MSEAAVSQAADIEERESVVIRFSGDSGDGMQLTGDQFTNTAAIIGNDVSTFPDFPAEIRAPVGTIPGLSGFQVNFSSTELYTPGDAPNVLVAMNPAAIKANLVDLEPGGVIIVNSDNFTRNNLRKAGYDYNPLEDGDDLKDYEVHRVPLNTLTRTALENVEGLGNKEIDRCKNAFALGLAFWMFDRPLDNTLKFFSDKFAKRPSIVEANSKALKAGYYFGETSEAFQARIRVSQRQEVTPGVYRRITGNDATVLGLVTAAQKSGLPLFYGSYPITPASPILEGLAALKTFDVRTFQAEDEIAAMGSVIGGAFGGALSATSSSGPGIALKSEAINLGVVMELPMIIINVQRGGPSTGLPTKTEQADLLEVLFGRNGESPMPVVAPATSTECFEMIYEACRLAVHYMTPVFFLSDGFIANNSEPWKIPDLETIAPIVPGLRTDPQGYQPYMRDPKTLARPWVVPGTAGMEHRIGGLGKQDVTGNVSYTPEDHQNIIRVRQEKIAGIANDIPELEVFGPESGSLLVLGWGGTYGALRAGVERAQGQGQSVAHAHVRYLNPFPPNMADVLSRFEKVLVPELNLGQLSLLIQGRYLKKVEGLNKVEGQPFKIREITEKINELLA
jgi:2-oxoglutarate/2-oxoacid ferredoxin oxidoreductase subunit alpha